MDVIIDVLITQRDREDALSDEGPHCVQQRVRVAAILEAARQWLDQADRSFRRPEQQSAGMRGDLAAVCLGETFPRWITPASAQRTPKQSESLDTACGSSASSAPIRTAGPSLGPAAIAAIAVGPEALLAGTMV
jgi:hypothetical protein